MPIIEDTPTTVPDEKPNNPVLVTSPAFKGVTVDTTYQPETSLLTHIEGMAWTVNYYSQVLDTDNALSSQSTDRDAVYQQYRLIQRLELKVTTPLNQQTQDTTTKEFRVSGQANVFPCGLIPNEGDIFIADGGDGRELLFMVTSSERRSIYKDAAFIIDYETLDYSNDRINDLNSKVVENLYYEADFLMHGQNPFISLNERNLINQLRVLYEEIAAFYFKRFTSKEYRTLLIPGQTFAAYDPFHTSAVLRMFRNEELPELKYIRELNVGDADRYQENTIWTAFLTKRRNYLRAAATRMGLLNARAFGRDPMQNSVRYSGVEYVVYPINGSVSWDSARHGSDVALADITLTPTDPEVVAQFDSITPVQLQAQPMAKWPVINASLESSYIFSEAFYQNAPTGQSAMEQLVQDYFDSKAYNLTDLAQVANSYMTWAPMEQFYQLPFLLAILRSAIRRM